VELLTSSVSGIEVERRIERQRIAVPAVFDAEVFAAIRRLLRLRAIDLPLAQGSLLETARLHAERHSLTELLPEAFALRDRFGAYDVFYVVLARRLGATLVTSDRPLARGAAGYVDVALVS